MLVRNCVHSDNANIITLYVVRTVGEHAKIGCLALR